MSQGKQISEAGGWQLLKRPWLPLAVLAGLVVAAMGWQRVLSLLPFALILICPLMHLFMHRHHHGAPGRHETVSQENGPRQLTKPPENRHD